MKYRLRDVFAVQVVIIWFVYLVVAMRGTPSPVAFGTLYLLPSVVVFALAPFHPMPKSFRTAGLSFVIPLTVGLERYLSSLFEKESSSSTVSIGVVFALATFYVLVVASLAIASLISIGQGKTNGEVRKKTVQEPKK